MGRNDKRRVASNFVSSLFGYALSITIGLILPRFFTLTYGSEVNGLIGSVNQFVVYLGLFEAGVGTATLQALYKPVALDYRNNISAVMNAAGAYYRKAGLYYLIGLIILCFGYPLAVKTEIGYFRVVAIVFLVGFINVLNFWVQGKYTVLLRAEGKNYILTNLNSVVNILTGVLKIVLIRMRVDVVLIMASAFLVNVGSMVFVFIYMKVNYKWLDRTISADYKAIEQKNYVLVHEISTLIFNNTDIIILTVFCGLKVVSVYTMYKLVITYLGNVLSTITTSVEFSLGQLYQTQKSEFAKRVDLCESVYSISFHAFNSVALFLFVPFMKLYTSGITDINYVDYKLAVLFVAIELLSSVRIMMLKTINFAGHFKLTTSRTITESVINLTVSLVAVQFWGIYGVLLGTVVALMYRTNDIIIYSNVRLIGRSPLKTYCIHILNLILLVVFQFVYRLLFPAIESYVTFALCGAAMVLMTAVTMTIVQMIAFPDFRSMLINGAKKLIGRQR